MGILFIKFWSINNWKTCLLIGISYLLYSIIHTQKTFRPPTCLLLATSKDKTINLQGRLETSLENLGVASLLEITDKGCEKKYGLDSMNIYRTHEDVEWFSSVENLIDFVPVIIVDGRFLSQAITKEISYLFKSYNENKVIFVVIDIKNNNPIFENLIFQDFRKKHPEGSIVLSEEELVQMLFFYRNYIFGRPFFKKVNFSEFKFKLPEILESLRKMEDSVKKREERIFGNWKQIFFWLSIKLKK
jgi:hypothetical protein